MINLHTTYYNSDNPVREKEISLAIQSNINLKQINKIYIYAESNFPLKHSKLEVIRISKRPSFQELSSNFQHDTINIICNSDIEFKKNIQKLNKLKECKNTVCFISRRMGMNIASQHLIFKHNVGNSQDAWAFFGKLPDSESLKNQLKQIKIGLPGNDNALGFIFKELGFDIQNPAYEITLLHHHKSDLRSYTHIDRINKNYYYIPVKLFLDFGLKSRAVCFFNRLMYHPWFR